MKYIGIISFTLLLGCKTAIKYPEGGYDYPKTVDAKDSTFFCYPLKQSFSKKDSFWTAHFSNYFFRRFNEPNLSIKPMDKAVFRLIYASFPGFVIIFTLDEDKIVVKESIKGYTYPAYDSTKLNELEKFHYDLLDRFYPLDEEVKKYKNHSSYDSLIKTSPELLNAAYFNSLLNKSADYGSHELEYLTKTIPISNLTFNYLVNQINSSGFWTLPYEVKCDNMSSDGGGFYFEANTPNKYKVVTAVE